jgi:hypothetical protein
MHEPEINKTVKVYSMTLRSVLVRKNSKRNDSDYDELVPYSKQTLNPHATIRLGYCTPTVDKSKLN